MKRKLKYRKCSQTKKKTWFDENDDDVWATIPTYQITI